MAKTQTADTELDQFTADKCKRCGEKVPAYREEFCTQKCRKIWKNPSPYSRA